MGIYIYLFYYGLLCIKNPAYVPNMGADGVNYLLLIAISY